MFGCLDGLWRKAVWTVPTRCGCHPPKLMGASDRHSSGWRATLMVLAVRHLFRGWQGKVLGLLGDQDLRPFIRAYCKEAL